MRYIIRAAKYFLYLVIILCLIILIMVKLKLVDGDINSMFIHGYDSIWQMALIVAVFAAVYPKFGYGRRNVTIHGSDEDVFPVLEKVMEDRGYKVERKDADGTRFIRASVAARAMRMWEDRISAARSIDGFELEGPTKDIVRIISAVEAVSTPDSEND